MKSHYNFLKNNPLFSGFSYRQFMELADFSGAKATAFDRGEVIIPAGSILPGLGIVLSGNIAVLKQDINGNNNIYMHLKAQGVFAEVFVCSGIAASPVTVIAESACEVLFLDYKKILLHMPIPDYRDKLTENLLMVISRKNLALNEKVACLGRRSIREKAASFLMLMAEKYQSNLFKIPYTRQQMADYLCVDRSALSYVLSLMKSEGLIDYNRDTFRILKQPE